MAWSEQQYSELIGLIYEAGLDLDAWPKLLESLSENMRSNAAVFRVSNVVNDQIYMGLTHGHDEAYLKSYRDYYIHNDPYRPALKRLPAGVFYPGQAAMPYEEVSRHEFYNEMLVANGLHYTLGGFAMRDNSLAYQVIVQRGTSAGDYSDEEIKQFNYLIPHLQRAFKINQRIATLQHRSDSMEMTLDQLSTGLVLVDTEGKVCFLNRKAEQIINAQPGLSIVSGKLAASSMRETAHLQQLIRQAIGKVEDRYGVVGGAMQLMPHAVGVNALSLLVTPLQRVTEIMAMIPNRASAAIFMGEPKRSGELNLEVMQMLYDLSLSEARLVAELASGLSLNEICEKFHVSHHTGRTQLKSAYAKTDTHHQAQLVSLILSSPAAL